MKSLENEYKQERLNKLKKFLKRTRRLVYDDFRKLAASDEFTADEKIFGAGRLEHTPQVYEDILAKLPNLQKTKQVVMDLGCGCGELTRKIIDLCQRNKHQLLLIDSAEMLQNVPDKSFIKKVSCRFPETPKSLVEYEGKVNAILCYDVLHYVFYESNIFNFLDRAVSMLASGGELLLGDLPNVSKRKRFLSTPAGFEYHKKRMGTNVKPRVHWKKVEYQLMNDGIFFAILQRYRDFGFETYLLPQPSTLEYWNRREDILIKRW